MRLYLANPTGQTRRYYYRLDFNDRGEFSEEMRKRSARFLQVESGRQGSIELQHISQVQTIMDQLARVGGMGAEELNRMPNQTCPVVMQIGRPVTGDQIRRVNAHNKAMLTQQGRKLRQTAAISANELVKQSVEATLKGFSVEFEQIDNPNEPAREGPRLGEGFEVPQTPQGPAGAQQPVRSPAAPQPAESDRQRRRRERAERKAASGG